MATQFKHHSGHYSDFDGANGKCSNCGVPTYNAPDIHDAHPIQMQYQTNHGDVYCEACFFDSYDRDGARIASPEKVTVYAVREEHRTRYYDNWQAASGHARRVDDARYLGAIEMYVAMLEKVD